MNIFSEKYELISELGHGAHSKVYLARHNKLNVLRAVKHIKKSEADYTRYLREANLIKNLKHSSIPIIYDIEEDNDSIYIIEEYISGKSLTMFMENMRGMQYKQVCGYGIQICEILEYMHNFNKKGILHLDLKPDNIIIDTNNTIRIIDYDNSSYENDILKYCIGSKGFAAPEQYHRLSMDKRADIYSLGMLLLYMSTKGYIQSNVEIIRQKNLSQIIKKCTKHNPIQRYDCVEKVRHDLMKLQNKLSVKSTNNSLKISVMGTKNGIGTTHICLCLTSFLNRKGYATVCIDNTMSGHIRNEAIKGNLTTNGTYEVNGAYLLPNYNQCIECLWEEEYQIAIIDMGTEKNCNMAQLQIVVAVGKYCEKEEKSVIRKLDDNAVCILNHMSGKQFYQYAKCSTNSQRVYRMPCTYEWKEQNESADSMFAELLRDVLPEYFSFSCDKKHILKRWMNYVQTSIYKMFKN